MNDLSSEDDSGFSLPSRPMPLEYLEFPDDCPTEED